MYLKTTTLLIIPSKHCHRSTPLPLLSLSVIVIIRDHPTSVVAWRREGAKVSSGWYFVTMLKKTKSKDTIIKEPQHVLLCILLLDCSGSRAVLVVLLSVLRSVFWHKQVDFKYYIRCPLDTLDLSLLHPSVVLDDH